MKKLLALLLIINSYCTVKSVWLKKDFAVNDKLKLKKLAVITEKNNLLNPVLADLMNSVSADYISHHKEYILKQEKSANILSACKKGEIDGYLLNQFLQKPETGANLLIDLQSTLYNCKTEMVWKVKAVKSYPARPVSNSIVESYSVKFGTNSKSYIFPFYDIVRKALKKLPDPKLNEADILEKIESESL